jgi:Domain of unknown function (DUF4349)
MRGVVWEVLNSRPMNSRFLALFALFALFLTSCSPFRMMSDKQFVSDYDGYEMMSVQSRGDDFESMGGARMMAPGVKDVAYAPQMEDRKMIYTAQLTLHVEDVRETSTEIKTFVEGLGGNLTDSNVTRGSNSYSGWLTVRVPVDQFQSALLGLKEMAVYVDSEYSNSQDVTEYYTDLGSRLTNKQAEEKQYLEILDKAETVTDILAVTQYLSSVRYEIESLQGQLKVYDSQIDYSTITVYLSEDESVSAVAETWKPVSTVRGAFSDWVLFLQGAMDAGIYLLIFIWPLVILVWAFRKWFRSAKKTIRK